MLWKCYISFMTFGHLYFQRLQAMLLAPLKELSNISHMDIRQRQLECALQLLQNGGDDLGAGWPAVLEVIGDGADSGGYVLPMFSLTLNTTRLSLYPCL